MKYDPALTLQLASLVEAVPSNDFLSVDQINISGYSRHDLCEHLLLLLEEDLVVGNVQYADNQIYELLVSRLTLKGHQLLAISRDQNKWRKFVSLAQAGIGFVTKEGFKIALTEMIKNLLT
jgi:hypothetical protein